MVHFQSQEVNSKTENSVGSRSILAVMTHIIAGGKSRLAVGHVVLSLFLNQSMDPTDLHLDELSYKELQVREHFLSSFSPHPFYDFHFRF
jgi:hypothetical protein